MKNYIKKPDQMVYIKRRINQDVERGDRELQGELSHSEHKSGIFIINFYYVLFFLSMIVIRIK